MDLVTFTEEMLIGKLNLFCSDSSRCLFSLGKKMATSSLTSPILRDFNLEVSLKLGCGRDCYSLRVTNFSDHEMV